MIRLPPCWYPTSVDDDVEVGDSPPEMKDGNAMRLMDIVGDGGSEDNGESSSSGHTNLGRIRCVASVDRETGFPEFLMCSKAVRAEAVGVKEPRASWASGCRVTRAEAVFTKSSVILECEEDMDVSETERGRGRGRDATG